MKMQSSDEQNKEEMKEESEKNKRKNERMEPRKKKDWIKWNAKRKAREEISWAG